MSEQTPARVGVSEPAGQQQDRRHEWRWVAACLAVSLVSLVMAGTLAYTHPPEVRPRWIVVEALGLAAAALILWRSALRPRGWPVRIALGLSLLLALPAVKDPFLTYYAAFQDFPWVALIPVGFALIAGSWVCRQKWLAICLCAAAVWLVIGAARSPSNGRLPRTVRVGDLTVTMDSLRRDGNVVFCSFSVKTKPKVRLDRVYDVQHIRVEGKTVWGLLPVTCRNYYPWFPEEYPPNEATISTKTLPPSWSRSLDYVIVVPRWPKHPATSVSFSVPPPGGRLNRPPLTSRGHGISLAVSEVRWSKSQTTSPRVPCLNLTVSYRGYPYSGWTGMELRASDQTGRILPIRPY